MCESRDRVRVLDTYTPLRAPGCNPAARACRSSTVSRSASACARSRPNWRDAVVPASLIVFARAWRTIDFDDEIVGEHALDRRVQRARTQLQATVGPRRHILHDCVAVPVLVRERDEDVERDPCHFPLPPVTSVDCSASAWRWPWPTRSRARLGFRLAFVAEQITTVWPPTGLALAALLLWGRSLWPAVWLGAFVANAGTGAPLWTARR